MTILSWHLSKWKHRRKWKPDGFVSGNGFSRAAQCTASSKLGKTKGREGYEFHSRRAYCATALLDILEEPARLKPANNR